MEIIRVQSNLRLTVAGEAFTSVYYRVNLRQDNTMVKQPMIRASVAIALGAIAGALSRYYLGLGIAHLLGSHFPFGTLVINATGCFVMGVLARLSVDSVLRMYPEGRLLLLTGFLGSYTTFSTYELESSNLLANHSQGLALLYWMGSPILGLLSLQGGVGLAERLLTYLDRTPST